MRLIDEEYLRHPFFGSGRMTDWLHKQNHAVNRKRVQRLMRTMGIERISPKRKTSRPTAGHKIYPYLLRDLLITHPDQVWYSFARRWGDVMCAPRVMQGGNCCKLFSPLLLERMFPVVATGGLAGAVFLFKLTARGEFIFSGDADPFGGQDLGKTDAGGGEQTLGAGGGCGDLLAARLIGPGDDASVTCGTVRSPCRSPKPTVPPQAIGETDVDAMAQRLRQQGLRFQRRSLVKIIAWAQTATQTDLGAYLHRRLWADLEADRQAKSAKITELEGEIATRLVQTPYVLLLAIPGINVVGCADFADEMGPIAHYANANAITGRAGLLSQNPRGSDNRP